MSNTTPDYTGASAQKYVDSYTNRPEDQGKILDTVWGWMSGNNNSAPPPEESVVATVENNPTIVSKNAVETITSENNSVPMTNVKTGPVVGSESYKAKNMQDSNTLDGIRGTFDPSNPEQVLKVQQLLNALGFTGKDGKPLSEDSMFGPNSEHAWREYINKSNVEQGREKYRWDDPSPKTDATPVEAKERNRPFKQLGGRLKNAWSNLDRNVFRGTLPGGYDRQAYKDEIADLKTKKYRANQWTGMGYDDEDLWKSNPEARTMVARDYGWSGEGDISREDYIQLIKEKKEQEYAANEAKYNPANAHPDDVWRKRDGFMKDFGTGRGKLAQIFGVKK